jgi:cytochrome c-type biogenesis protein CcmF
MDYTGEHLLPGQLGHFFIVLSLVASLIATFCYFRATQAKSDIDAAGWKKLARYAFLTEVVSVFAIFSILFYIIYNHLFEYKYAWQHSSLSLELKYLLACFWEGQEGSFLLWSIWHCLLGLVIIRTAKKWESPVMTIVSFAQFALATMIAGIYVFGHKIGSNPFLLLRDSGVLDNAPALHLGFDVTQPLRPDYMTMVKDGNDLNPLLQNYWMVIHPPVLFLGFASTIIPFAFAIAGLWTKKFGEWTKHALPWALFSAAVFGIGIMMGARWAYESLSFGGYWAWDPVENASLVPWLVLIAGIHTLLIYKHSGHSLRSTHLFFILSFGLVLYSTFLTRSGILGETSVHAFTDLGMNAQLYLLMYVFIWGAAILGAKTSGHKLSFTISALVMLIPNFFVSIPALGLIALLTGLGYLIYTIQSQVPTIHKEENTSSREFWMFIGALVFFLSAVVIIAKTSLPVLNKVFGLKIATSEDPEYAYNSIQVYIAVIVALLTAVGQYLKYKDTSGKYFWKKILMPSLISVAICAALLAFLDINYDKKGPMFQGALWLALLCSVYTVVANTAYIWLGVKGSLKLSGGSISHVGFGLVLIGILISSSNKEVLSKNTSGIMVPFSKESGENPGENLTLVKGVKMDMGTYWVTYEKDEQHPEKPKTFFSVKFEKKDSSETFTLRPNAFVNYKMDGLQANPDAMHHLTHDVFAYVTSYLAKDGQKEDTAVFKTHTLHPGDSVFYSNGFIIFDSVTERKDLPVETFGPDGKVYEAKVTAYSKRGSSYTIQPKLAFAKGATIAIPDTIVSESLAIQLQKINPDQSADIGVKESDSLLEYVTLKVYKFPFINLLWAGVVITAIGILISMVRRIQLNRIKGGNSGL